MTRLALAVASLVALSTVATAGCSSKSDDAPVDDGATAPTDDGGTPEAEPTSDAGDAGDAGSDVDNGAPSATYPAPHPPLPTLVNQAHGKTLASPKVYLVFFPGYAYEQQLLDMAQKLGASAYWSAAVGEFGVGPVTFVGSTEVQETAPTSISDTEVDAWMNAKIAAGAFGEPDASTIYTVFYPSTTTITQSGGGPFGGGSSCSSFGGYHSDTAVAGEAGTTNYPYAVLPTCASFGNLKGVDAVTGALSHEWAEASTDPFPSTNNGLDSAYSGVDDDHFIWNLLGGAEDGDLCAQRDDAFFKTPGLDYVTQSCWSNTAAKAGGDPCMPKGSAPYFNAAPVQDDKVTLDLSAFGSGSIATKGIKIAKGASKTIEVDLFSDADTGGPWTVKAVDVLAQYTKSSPTLDFAWDRTSGQNGEKLHLTITVTGASAFGKAHPFLVASKLGTSVQLWPALVSE